MAAADLALIAGQKPVITKARKAIAQFKVRENMPIGAKVTLRKARMYEFLDRLVNDRAAARARLPRPEPEVVRRARQLRARHQGAPRVPGDQLRQGRAGLGHGRHRRHDGEDRRRGPRAAASTSTSRSGSEGTRPQTRTLERDQMAKKSSIEKNKRRRELVKQYRRQARAAPRRSPTTSRSPWRSASRRASSWRSCRATRNPTRIRNRCEVTGRPRAYYRKLEMSRIALRELGSQGPDPGPRQVELVRRSAPWRSTIPSAICSPASATRRCAASGTVSTPGSRLRARVLDVLKSEGYIRDYSHDRVRQRPHRVRRSS